MAVNTAFLIVVAAVGFLTIILLFAKNQKDRKQLTDTLNNDYPKEPVKEDDIEVVQRD